MLRHLERRLGGRPLGSMFDLIVGTSTGAIQAVGRGGGEEGGTRPVGR